MIKYCMQCRKERLVDAELTGWLVIRNKQGIVTRKVCPVCSDQRKAYLKDRKPY